MRRGRIAPELVMIGTTLLGLVRNKIVHLRQCRRHNPWFRGCEGIDCRVNHPPDASLQGMAIRTSVILLQLAAQLAPVLHFGLKQSHWEAFL